MINAFRSYISENRLCQPGDKILLAVSGGIDSVTMTDLFHQAGFRFGIAHCNFGLRGKESDGDEKFVESMAKKYQVPVYIKRYGSADFADKTGFSTQMAARQLRYNWFEETRINEGYDFIATAHHLDDQAETFFINLARGTGIAGLHGILPRQGSLIRPMLFTTREEIAAYAKSSNLRYREDSSNLSLKYLRNKIRHELLPILKEITPGIISSLTDTIGRLREFEAIGQQIIEEKRKKILRISGSQIRIGIAGLKALTPPAIYSWELLSPYGFNATQVTEIIRSLGGESGKTFYSPSHRLIREREELVITPITDTGCSLRDDLQVYSIEEESRQIDHPVRLKFEVKKHSPRLPIPPDREFATLDYDKLEFPLTLRKWQKGDSFCPFGMTKKQKLSDFFINAKISLSDKEESWLLCSGSRIAWVVGYRIDNRFRITSRTRNVLQVRVTL